MSTATAKKKKAPPAAARTTLRSWEWIAEQAGTPQWCVAARLTEGLKHKGYECAIPPKRYNALWNAWERAFYGAPLSSLHEAAPEILAALTEILEIAERDEDVVDGPEGPVADPVMRIAMIAREALRQIPDKEMGK